MSLEDVINRGEFAKWANDPLTPPDELEDLAMLCPSGVALNPSAPINLLMSATLLSMANDVVEQNPVWPLIALEDPGLYQTCWHRLDEERINQLSKLHKTDQRVAMGIIAQFADHVSHLLLPGVSLTITHERISDLRKFATANMTGLALSNAAVESEEIRSELFALGGSTILNRASEYAMNAAFSENIAGSAMMAQLATKTVSGQEASDQELRWQADIGRQYFRDHPVKKGR